VVMEELDRQGVVDDTAIIISADHGDAFGEHGIYSDHVCADECIHHIPLIVRWPGVSIAGAVSDALLYNVDLGPTLCDLLDMPVPEDWDGASFKANLAGEEGLDRAHLMVRTYDNYGYSFEPVELYNMVEDPYQTTNIRDEHPEIVAQCSTHLEDWIQEQWMKGHCIPDPLAEILRERGDTINSDAQWEPFRRHMRKSAREAPKGS
jgi:choline-sulfatase